MNIQALDFFCGCGGTSLGFQKAGVQVILGLDNDPDASATYQHNFPGVPFLERDIAEVSISDIRTAISEIRDPNSALLISACAPCQPFSQLRSFDVSPDDPRRDLLGFLGSIVQEFLPEYVFIENVPKFKVGIQDSTPFPQFRQFLESLGYVCRAEVVECQAFGVPQVRKRLIMLATKVNSIVPWPKATHGPGTGRDYPTVWKAIGSLPPLEAGSAHPRIKNHVAASLSPLNTRRIRSTPPEGSRCSWPEDLKLKCHDEHTGHSDVYGRLRKHAPAPAMTTRCISLSNGRFGHPEQHRAITVREAACLQTFKRSFFFKGCMAAQARQVGNAVPVRLSQCSGRAFMAHWKKWGAEQYAGI